MIKKLRLVIISDTIRRDLHHPLDYFKSFEISHFYRQASYDDMKEEDFLSPKAIKFSGLMDLYQKIKTAKPTILQVPEPAANRTSFMAGLVCLIYYYFYKPKIVMPFFENIPFKNKFNYLMCFAVSFMTKCLGNKASKLFVLNEGAKNNLIKLKLPKEKMVSLLWGSWGIDTEEFRPKNNKHKQEILFLGRVAKSKGILTLMSAFKIIHKKLPDARLLIAGQKSDAFESINYANAQYIGTVKNSDVPNLLSEAIVVVMPSETTDIWEEQVGMVGLQALACSTCVVATKSGAIPEYFKQDKGAQLIPQKDPESLANAIVKILTDNTYRIQQEKLGRNYIQSHYEVKNQIDKIEKVLLSIVN